MKTGMKDFSVTLENYPCDTQIIGNVLASGDDALDREAEDKVISELNRGNLWSWCDVRVTLTHRYSDYEVAEYLGACSYSSEQGFVSSGHYDDLIDECIRRMREDVGSIKESLDKL